MHKKLFKKKLKPIILLIYLQNIDIASSNAATSILSNLYKKSPIILLLTLFWLELPLLNYEKMGKEPIDKF